MAINLSAVAQYIHGASPSALDGLYQVVEEKCKALGLEPGRRDNVGVGKDTSGGNINMRGVLTFVENVQPLPEALPDDAEAVAADTPQATDDTETLLVKRQRNDHRRAAKAAHERRVEQVQGDHEALRKLYGTLKAKFATSGYTPKKAGGALA